MILLLGNVRSSVMEDVKETEIGLLAKKNVNNPVVTFLYIENNSNNIFNIRSTYIINTTFSKSETVSSVK